MTASFDDKFFGLTGERPFPWQRALYERLVRGEIPRICDYIERLRGQRHDGDGGGRGE